jgi:hypothetical protein
MRWLWPTTCSVDGMRDNSTPFVGSTCLVSAWLKLRLGKGRVSNALPIFAAWGVWHDDQTLEPAAIRPVTWLLGRVPEQGSAICAGDKARAGTPRECRVPGTSSSS